MLLHTLQFMSLECLTSFLMTHNNVGRDLVWTIIQHLPFTCCCITPVHAVRMLTSFLRHHRAPFRHQLVTRRNLENTSTGIFESNTHPTQPSLVAIYTPIYAGRMLTPFLQHHHAVRIFLFLYTDTLQYMLLKCLTAFISTPP